MTRVMISALHANREDIFFKFLEVASKQNEDFKFDSELIHFLIDNNRWEIIKKIINKYPAILGKLSPNLVERLLCAAALTKHKQSAVINLFVEKTIDQIKNNDNVFNITLCWAARSASMITVNSLLALPNKPDINQYSILERLAQRDTTVEEVKDITQTILSKCDHVNIERIPVASILNKEKSQFFAQVQAIAELQKDCNGYLKHLSKKTKVNDNKIGQVKALQATLHFANVEVSLKKFEKLFNSNDCKKILKTNPDTQSKKYLKRIGFAIATAGIYVVVRGVKLGTVQFWKSRKQVFVEKLEHKSRKHKV